MKILMTLLALVLSQAALADTPIGVAVNYYGPSYQAREMKFSHCRSFGKTIEYFECKLPDPRVSTLPCVFHYADNTEVEALRVVYGRAGNGIVRPTAFFSVVDFYEKVAAFVGENGGSCDDEDNRGTVGKIIRPLVIR